MRFLLLRSLRRHPPLCEVGIWAARPGGAQPLRSLTCRRRLRSTAPRLRSLARWLPRGHHGLVCAGEDSIRPPATDHARRPAMLLEGRRTLITGGSSGIGRATAERLGREGASVCVNHYSDHGGGRRRGRAPDRGLRRAGDRRSGPTSPARTRSTRWSPPPPSSGARPAGQQRRDREAGAAARDVRRRVEPGARHQPHRRLPLPPRGGRRWPTGGGVIVNMSVHEFIPWPGFAHYCAGKGGSSC